MNTEELRTFFGMLKMCANGEGQIIIDNDMCKELQKNIEYLIKYIEQQDIKMQEMETNTKRVIKYIENNMLRDDYSSIIIKSLRGEI